ncbi:reverse transcriptase [Plakobranchus ocellatus]|uniref:Reverse transcriptase n=1 Tax=Plakobranchus ocellatus TaxID=259542 RepID=A0AAV3YDS4_9GAST|nr:reverse transcriptase [Plakobranchus ocellatus]
MRLRGPFKIIDRISSVNYRVQIDNRIVTLHVNLLRRYYPHEVDNLESATPEPKEALTLAAMSALIEEDTPWVKPTVYTGPELNGQVDINPALSKERKEEVLSILKEFPDVLTSKPGYTPTLEHSIKLKTEEPIFVQQYPLPFSAKKVIEEEVRSLLNLGVIAPSTSPYCSPVVLVKKKDGSVRFCIDFRKLNAATVLDATNIPNPEDLFVELKGSRMFTSCDLAKAYWQVPLDEASRPCTAFQTPMGLMQWVRMPFGLVTTPATFNRLMR